MKTSRHDAGSPYPPVGFRSYSQSLSGFRMVPESGLEPIEVRGGGVRFHGPEGRTKRSTRSRPICSYPSPGEPSKNVCMKCDPLEFERCFVALIAKAADDNNIPQAQLARIAFGEDESSEVRWRKMRREVKPQRLTLAESLILCRALGIDFLKMVVRADLCAETNSCPLANRQKPTRRSA